MKHLLCARHCLPRSPRVSEMAVLSPWGTLSPSPCVPTTRSHHAGQSQEGEGEHRAGWWEDCAREFRGPGSPPRVPPGPLPTTSHQPLPGAVTSSPCVFSVHTSIGVPILLSQRRSPEVLYQRRTTPPHPSFPCRQAPPIHLRLCWPSGDRAGARLPAGAFGAEFTSWPRTCFEPVPPQPGWEPRLATSVHTVRRSPS